jgi:hypothetical protein
MPDNWSFVIAAYLLAAVVLGAYWRHLVKKERELESPDPMDRPARATEGVGGHVNQSVKGTSGMALNQSVKGTEPRAPGPGHLRSEPSTRRPLP